MDADKLWTATAEGRTDTSNRRINNHYDRFPPYVCLFVPRRTRERFPCTLVSRARLPTTQTWDNVVPFAFNLLHFADTKILAYAAKSRLANVKVTCSTLRDRTDAKILQFLRCAENDNNFTISCSYDVIFFWSSGLHCTFYGFLSVNGPFLLFSFDPAHQLFSTRVVVMFSFFSNLLALIASVCFVSFFLLLASLLI